MRRLATLILAGLTLPSTALAGGVGLLTTGGFHQSRAYYYDTLGNQGVDSQTRLNLGGGLIAMLGDKDDRVQGVMRVWFLQDQALANPDTGNTTDAVFPDVASVGPRDLGIFTAGIQWGLFGDPSKIQLTLETHAGSGFLTKDATEFLLVEVGPGFTWGLSDGLVLFGSLTADMRYRKGASMSENLYLGARYMFD